MRRAEETRVEADAMLVARARGGDDAAFGQLVRRHHASVHRAACTILGSTTDAEDVAQDAWLHAYVHLAQFQQTASFNTWVHAIVRNCAIDYHRRARRRRWYGDARTAILPAHDQVRCAAPNPEELVLGAEREHRLMVAVASLPDRLRAALELWHTEQYSYEEMARLSGVRTGTIKSRLWQARREVALACAGLRSERPAARQARW